jgi:23S rRNA pseudouridine1911/1915/1917 synthase
MKYVKTEPKTIEYVVSDDCELLAFLTDVLPSKKKSSAKAWLKYRAVRVDGAVVTQYNHRLARGQTVIINPQPGAVDLQGIIYEDDEFIVMNKPEGLLSVATENEREKTAYRLLTEHVKKSDPQSRIFIVHRLDRDTSGVLLAAKTKEMKLLLQDNWAQLVKLRAYTAVVEGRLTKPEDTLHSWLRETSTHMVYESGSAGDGLEAVTEYSVIKQSAKFSLLNVRLLTGRKNQIRVQLSGIGHPVVGDSKYGAATNPIKRLCLHANMLEITHPVTQNLLSFSAELPAAFLKLFPR